MVETGPNFYHIQDENHKAIGLLDRLHIGNAEARFSSAGESLLTLLNCAA